MAVATWTAADGWHDSAVVPYGPFALDPATAVLHYAQGVFEGLKAYRHPDDTVWLFRPEKNAERFARSARRLALPELSHDDFIASIEALVAADLGWVPEGGEKSLYLRPFMFASEAFLGVRPAQRVSYCVHRESGRTVLRVGHASRTDLDHHHLHPGGTGRDRGGQVRRELRRQPHRAAGGLRPRL